MIVPFTSFPSLILPHCSLPCKLAISRNMHSNKVIMTTNVFLKYIGATYEHSSYSVRIVCAHKAATEITLGFLFD